MTVEEWLGQDNIIGIDIWHKKYQYNNESFDEWLNRVSGGNKNISKLILEKKFLFGGRILANRGTKDKCTYSNCYVLPSPEDNLESIFECAKQMARTYSYGGGVGIHLGKLAPKGAKVHNTAKESSGAASFMSLYDLTTGLIGQNGRRGALMMAMPINHPDIELFIDSKKDVDKLNNANISVMIDDNFMTHVLEDKEYDLVFGRPETNEWITKKINAKELFYKICEQNWNNGEPGILFWSRIIMQNIMCNDPEYSYECVNPCSELPLPSGGSCLLGAINLSEFVKHPFRPEAFFDYKNFKKTVNLAVIAMNEVLDEGKELHPLSIQRLSVDKWRQIGLGIMGLADCLIKLNLTYGSEEANKFCEHLSYDMFKDAFESSANLGEKIGDFKGYNQNHINVSPMVEEILKRNSNISNEHLCNSNLLTIAPTGTISTMLGVSGGMEPMFAREYDRKTKTLHGEDVVYHVVPKVVQEYMTLYSGDFDLDLLPKEFVVAREINYEDRLQCQAAWQHWIDASISSTINLPESATVEDIENVYIRAWELGLKGVTVFRESCDREGILYTKSNDEDANKIIQQYNYIKPISRTTIGTTHGKTYCKKCACGTLYITLNKDDNDNLVESFVQTSKGGVCQANIGAVNRMISLSLRSGTMIDEIIDQLKGINCPACTKLLSKGEKISGISCADILAKTIEEFIDTDKKDSKLEKEYYKKHVNERPNNMLLKKMQLPEEHRCPECGEAIVHEGGCVICKKCGYSKCN